MKKIFLAIIILVTAAISYSQQFKTIDSLASVINDKATYQNVDGWYRQSISPDTSDAERDIHSLYRGVGSMDNRFDVTSKCMISKIGIRCNDDSTKGGLRVHLFKNGYNTGLYVNLGFKRYYDIAEFPDSVCLLYPGDYIDLRYSFDDYLETVTSVNVKAFIELKYPFTPVYHQHVYGVDEGRSLKHFITATAVDSGSILIKNMSGDTVDNQSYVDEGDTLLFIASTNISGYTFNCWTGNSVINEETYSAADSTWSESQRYNDSLYIIVTDDINIKARFNKTQTVRVLFVGNDEDSVDLAITAFEDTYEYAALESWAGTSETIIDSSLEYIFKRADQVGAEIIVFTYNDFDNAKILAQKYYPVQVVMPASGYERMRGFYKAFENTSSIILIGQAYEQYGHNQLGYGCEFVTMNIHGNVYSLVETMGAAGALFVASIDGYIATSQEGANENYTHFTEFKDYFGARHMFRWDTDDMYPDSKIREKNLQDGYGYIDETFVSEGGYTSYYYDKIRRYPYYFRSKDIYLLK